MTCTTNSDDLRNNNDQKLSRVENILRSKYLEIVKPLSYTEIKIFNKHNYKWKIQEEMMQLLPAMNTNPIDTSFHYISNALNNEAQRQ